MRIYDPRLGKFLSVDPLTYSYPWNSPYFYAEGDPINYPDLDGGEQNTTPANITRPSGIRISRFPSLSTTTPPFFGNAERAIRDYNPGPIAPNQGAFRQPGGWYIYQPLMAGIYYQTVQGQ